MAGTEPGVEERLLDRLMTVLPLVVQVLDPEAEDFPNGLSLANDISVMPNGKVKFSVFDDHGDYENSFHLSRERLETILSDVAEKILDKSRGMW